MREHATAGRKLRGIEDKILRCRSEEIVTDADDHLGVGEAIERPYGAAGCNNLGAELGLPRHWRIELRYPRFPIDRPNRLVRLDMLINEEAIDAFTIAIWSDDTPVTVEHEIGLPPVSMSTRTSKPRWPISSARMSRPAASASGEAAADSSSCSTLTLGTVETSRSMNSHVPLDFLSLLP